MTDGFVRRRSRREVLGTIAAGGVVALAGCGGGGDGNGSGDLGPPVAGDPDADVTLAVYEDFGCPHCAHYNESGFPTIRSDYLDDGQIRYEHRDFPIPVLDPGSWQAASAARSVQDQAGDDAFFEYAHAVFANQRDIPAEAPALYETLASDLSVEASQVREDAVSEAYESVVSGDRDRGIDQGVQGTPAFVVDGEVVASGFGGTTTETVTAAIDEALGTRA